MDRHPRLRPVRLAIARLTLALALIVGLAGCGNSSGSPIATSASPTTTFAITSGTASSGTGTVGPGSTVTAGGGAPSTSAGPRPTSPPPTPAPPAPPGAGAYGYVTAGPTCPVERPDQPCPPRPVAAHVEAENASGHTVAATDSDSAGRYRLTLAPGAYTLVATTTSSFPRCSPTPVTVRAGGPTRADISCDTGIR